VLFSGAFLLTIWVDKVIGLLNASLVIPVGWTNKEVILEGPPGSQLTEKTICLSRRARLAVDLCTSRSFPCKTVYHLAHVHDSD
jgi:hypothetical protein